MSTAIAKLGTPRETMRTVQELTARMREIQDSAFVCSPFANIDTIPEFFRISERVVVIDPDPEQHEVYFSKQFCKPGEVALAKPGLMKLWLASGGQVIASHRTDDRSDPHLCSWECVGEYRQIDGNIVRVHGNRELDYRDGSEQIKGLTPGDIAQKRRAIQSLAETFALERMQRSAINLQQKYRTSELGSKPFACYALVPDVSREQDPVIRRMAAAQALGIVRDLYGADAARIAISGPAAAPMRETTDGKVDLATGEIVNGDTAEDDFPPLPSEPAQTAETGPPIRLCACPCHCQREVNEAAAAATVKHIGTIRCRECYPGRGFLYEKHKDLVSLQFPNDKSMTPSKAEGIAAALRKGA